ncbi:MAG: GPW/gp25 family protein [Acetivibrio sp.]
MNNNDMVKDFLGTGWKFPVEVDETTGRIKTSSYEKDVEEAIRLILLTRKGERAMEPTFGCDIQNYLFEVLDYTTMSQMEHEILESLLLWEPRIIDPEVKVEADEVEIGRINIQISYVVRATNNPFNVVYPYYINEGTI